MQLWRRACLPCCLALFCAGSAPAAEDVASMTREAFVAAMDRVSLQPAAAVAPIDDDALRAYALYPYLQAARLRARLAKTPSSLVAPGSTLPLDSEIESFITAQGDQPVTRPLRRDWLRHLAARRDWTAYLKQYQPTRDTLAEQRCNALAARIATGTSDGLDAEATELWLTGRSLPDACDPVWDWWRARGGPGDALTLRRARLALEAGESGLARHLARSLAPADAGPVMQWVALIEQPRRSVAEAITNPDRVIEPAALRDGWFRYARADPDAAAADFPALVQARKLDARSASAYALSVALALAWNRHDGALAFFQKVHGDDFDERAHEWHARAAAWAGDWRELSVAVAAMPDALRKQPRWQYWAARANEQLGDRDRARAEYASVVSTDNWYAVQAAARLGQRFAPTQQPLTLVDGEIARLGAQPGFVRAQELLECDMPLEAEQEWRVAYDGLTPDLQRQAVGLAARWGWYYQSIASAAKQQLFNDYALFYPRPYDREVASAARSTRLPPELIYAIIRQESLYRPGAGSSAGALGLMQLMPGTARIVARRIGVPVPTRAQLLVPAINVPLGSQYLSQLLERFAGETALASAAYNAGPNAARRWLPPRPMDLDAWAENIPFNETRTYVQRVAWHTLVFAWLEDRRPRDVSGWLRTVQPETPATAQSWSTAAQDGE